MAEPERSWESDEADEHASKRKEADQDGLSLAQVGKVVQLHASGVLAVERSARGKLARAIATGGSESGPAVGGVGEGPVGVEADAALFGLILRVLSMENENGSRKTELGRIRSHLWRALEMVGEEDSIERLFVDLRRVRDVLARKDGAQTREALRWVGRALTELAAIAGPLEKERGGVRGRETSLAKRECA